MVRVKICGVTNLEDALLAAELGAHAIGLNFYSESPRCVSPFTAAEIVRQLPQVPARQIIAEPAQRNTAPAIGLAAHILA